MTWARSPSRAWPCCAWTGCARWSTCIPAWSARTRWSPRSTTACTARAGRPRRSTPRCTAWSTPPTSITCIPTPASRSPPPPTENPSHRRSSVTAWCGCRGAGRASNSGWTSPRSSVATRRPSGASSGVTASPRGATPQNRPRRTRCRSSVAPKSSSPPTAETSLSAPNYPAIAHCPNRTAGRRPPRWHRSCAVWHPRTRLRSATSPTPQRCWTSSPPPSIRGWLRWAPAAPITSCAPRSNPSYSTCPPTRPSRSARTASPNCTRRTGRTTGPITSATRAPTAPRCAAPTRRSS